MIYIKEGILRFLNSKIKHSYYEHYITKYRYTKQVLTMNEVIKYLSVYYEIINNITFTYLGFRYIDKITLSIHKNETLSKQK